MFHFTSGEGDTSTGPVAAPPDFDLSQILLQLTTQWTGAEGTTRTWLNRSEVFYSMPDTAPNLSNSEDNGFQIMSTVKKDAARLSFELWDDLMAISLTENNDPNTDITFAYSTTTGNSTYASMRTTGSGPDYGISTTRIWLANQWSTHNDDADMYYGGYGYITYIHEIGHALGLSHPGTYNGTADFEDDAEYSQDTRQWTVMSYFNADENGSGVDHRGSDNQWKYASTPMLHDVMAIQAKYGADMTTRTGNTVYGFNATAGKSVFDFSVNFDPIICIWDAGGEDTLNVSGYTTNQRISLVPGTYSDVGYMTMNVAIAYGAIIERATGGSGADHITGNDANNNLNGNAGNDTLIGGLGNDTLIGGAGADAMNGGEGLDYASYITATAGVTINLVSGVNAGDATGDTFVAIERFRLTAQADDFTGDANTNYAYGAEGNDTLRGGGGFDRLYGELGDDVLFGDADNDVLIGGEGADAINGGGGNDGSSYETSASAVSLNLTSGVHTGDAFGDTFTDIEFFILTAHDDTFVGGAGADQAQGGNGVDTLSGAGGVDWMRGQGGNDILNGDLGDDTLEGGAGADQLNGGDGVDYASYTTAVSVNLTSGVHTGDALGDVFNSIERFKMSNLDDTFFGSAGADWVAGYNGADTLNGADGDDTLNGGGGSDTLIGGAGRDKLIGDVGNDTLTGGLGNDIFQLTAPAFGNDTITDFGNGADYIRVTGIAGVDDFSDLVVTQNGGNAVITFPDGSTVTLTGVSAATVDANDFSFG